VTLISKVYRHYRKPGAGITEPAEVEAEAA
jgi:hypothetical protein